MMVNTTKFWRKKGCVVKCVVNTYARTHLWELMMVNTTTKFWRKKRLTRKKSPKCNIS